MRVIGVTGVKNGGKTHLVERLAAHLTAAGHDVGTVKRAHHAVEVDVPGTDSWRHRQAGARQVALVSSERVALYEELRGGPEPSLRQVLARMEAEIVLVEGWKAGDHPKIECWRAAAGRPPLEGISGRVAYAADAPPPGAASGVPVIDLDDTAALAEVVLAAARPPGAAARFDAVIAMDWSATSGRTAPGPNAIWSAAADRAGVGAATHWPTRHAAIAALGDTLEANVEAGRRTLVVLDVSFGWPAGAARHVTGSADPLALWDWMAEALRDGPDGRNDRFQVAARLNALLPGEGPFWGHPAGRSVDGLSPTKPAAPAFGEWRATEDAMRAAGGLAGRPKSVWQLAYTGSVGSQTLTAMAALAGLRQRLGADCAVWPFEPPDAPVVLAEVYLAHADGAAPSWPDPVRDARQVRAMAGGLFGALGGGADLFADVPAEAAEEGWVLGIGHEARIDAAARAAAPDPGS